MIAILDYGAGNLRSVTNALRVLAVGHELVRDGESLQRASKIILPGVGHFGQMMRSLDAMQVRDALRSRIRAGVPFLGICLGLQALFESSEEAPDVSGLGLFSGSISRFAVDARVPHMGWDEIEARGETESGASGSGSRSVRSELIEALPARPYVYFAHSYFAPVVPATAAVCTYGGVAFTAALECENVFAVQFHPEKSGAIGGKLLQKFAGI